MPLKDVQETESRTIPLFGSPLREAARCATAPSKDVYDAAATSVGLDGLRIHDLRHTAASLAIGVGANVKAVEKMLGHASAAMTLDVYSGLFDDDLESVADRLGEAAAASRVYALCTGSPDDQETKERHRAHN
jgi:integrase